MKKKKLENEKRPPREGGGGGGGETAGRKQFTVSGSIDNSNEKKALFKGGKGTPLGKRKGEKGDLLLSLTGRLSKKPGEKIVGDNLVEDTQRG